MDPADLSVFDAHQNHVYFWEKRFHARLGKRFKALQKELGVLGR
jgi:hypothetical protein